MKDLLTPQSPNSVEGLTFHGAEFSKKKNTTSNAIQPTIPLTPT
jgi:hypothetical protein